MFFFFFFAIFRFFRFLKAFLIFFSKQVFFFQMDFLSVKNTFKPLKHNLKQIDLYINNILKSLLI
jgi:hypothetical protein